MNKTKTTLLYLLLICFICTNSFSQSGTLKPDLTLTVKTADATSKKPVINVIITVMRDDSLKVTALNDGDGKLILRSKDSNFIALNRTYIITLYYDSPVSLNNSLYDREFNYKFSTIGPQKESNFNEIYYSTNIDPEVIDLTICTVEYKNPKTRFRAPTDIAIKKLKTLFKEYPNFEITLQYVQTYDHDTDTTLKFDRLEYLVDLLPQKGIHIRRITTCIKYTGCCDESDVCEILLTGFNFGRQF